MTTAELYHYFADDCLRGAERADNPKQRALLLKLAAEWLIAAQQIYEASSTTQGSRNVVGKSDKHPNPPH
jgi:hypothetical protein